MKTTVSTSLVAIVLAASSAAQQTAYGQCGGAGWSGLTTCVSGYTCTYGNDYYSQCLPGSGGSPPPTTTKPVQTTGASGGSSPTSTAWIVPGAVWYDSDGKKIDAHGGGIVQRGDTFYWTGHSGDGEHPMMYSSTDLVHWQNLGQQASVTGMWRPKFAKPNGKFSMYGQQDRYVLSLVSNQLVGGYSTEAKVYLPPNSYSYSDTGMFYDPSSTTWYLLTSADHNIIQINQINADGSVGDRVTSFAKGAYEAPGLFLAGGVYFLVASGKTGWRSNPNKVFWATSIAGPWNGGFDIAPEAENTYSSQNTFELTIAGSQQTTYIYMGDAWDSKGSAASNYVWLPMSVSPSAKTVTLDYHSMWSVNTQTGVVSFPGSRKRYEAEHGRLSGRAIVEECSHCLTKRAVHNIRSGSEVTFYNVTGSGIMEWVSFHYTVNDPSAGEAYVVINGDSWAKNLSDFNSRAGHHGTVPVQLALDSGDTNTVTFGALGTDDFEIRFDGFELH